MKNISDDSCRENVQQFFPPKIVPFNVEKYGGAREATNDSG
jgi:hypothetical protein